MDKMITLIKKGFLVAVAYNICVLIMMIDNMYVQISFYFLGLAITGTMIYKLQNLIIGKINRRISKHNEKR